MGASFLGLDCVMSWSRLFSRARKQRNHNIDAGRILIDGRCAFRISSPEMRGVSIERLGQ